MDAFRKMLAAAALRYDTQMSRAMLRALGVDIPKVPTVRTVVRADDRRYDGAAKLMRQRFGVRL